LNKDTENDLFVAQDGAELVGAQTTAQSCRVRALDRSAYGKLSVRLAMKVPTPVLHKL
jgi:hypothetical protein